MIRSVLFDLDGTLVHYEADDFLGPYLGGLGRRASHIVDPRILSRQLMKSTQTMVRAADPSRTCEQVFAQDFFSSLGAPEDQLQQVIEDYYAEDYPLIQQTVGILPHPDARPMVQSLIDRGYEVVIATNPVFPLPAIEERMRWGGVLGLPYKLITSYETSCFCKPNPDYYQEILDKISRRPEECIMVGNHMVEDMVASTLGITTYLVEDYVMGQDGATFRPDFTGKFSDLVQFLASPQFEAL